MIVDNGDNTWSLSGFNNGLRLDLYLTATTSSVHTDSGWLEAEPVEYKITIMICGDKIFKEIKDPFDNYNFYTELPSTTEQLGFADFGSPIPECPVEVLSYTLLKNVTSQPLTMQGGCDLCRTIEFDISS